MINIKSDNIKIEILNSIPLSKFDCHIRSSCEDAVKDLKNKYGIYFIVDKNKLIIFEKNKFIPSRRIKYIGKTSRESIFHRNRKHNQSFRGRLGAGLRPGARLKNYSKSIGYDINKLWVIAGIMNVEYPYMISLAEEYFLFLFEEKFKDLPQANTAGKRKMVK